MKTLLHVGCGFSTVQDLPSLFHSAGWSEIRYDIDPVVAPDIVGEAQDMSLIEDASIDALYSSHSIEHVWAFEVPRVLTEFLRVLRPDGFVVILCPDVMQVAEAIVRGSLDQPLYISPAGPITAMDVLYGYQSDLAKGNHFMAHKTAFTSQTLAQALHDAGFPAVVVARDKVFGLHAIAFPVSRSRREVEAIAGAVQPDASILLETLGYGAFTLDET